MRDGPYKNHPEQVGKYLEECEEIYDRLRFHKKRNMTVKQICEYINASREALYRKLEDKSP